MPYIRRQQANSHQGRASYIGLSAPSPSSYRQAAGVRISFVDTGGNRVRARAKSTEPNPLPKATPVYIADVDADYVHVVAVPDL